MVAGELAVTFGVTEPNAGLDTSRITTMAVRRRTTSTSSTARRSVLHAQRAEKCLLLCRTATRGANGEPAVSGMSMLMADLKVPQVTIKKIDGWAATRSA